MIPSHPVYGLTRMEEGVVIGDASRASTLRLPPRLDRPRRGRRALLRDTIGIKTSDFLLLLPDPAGIITLAPDTALTPV